MNPWALIISFTYIVVDITHLARFMDFLAATAHDLSFAKSLVDYDDKNLTKAMT